MGRILDVPKYPVIDPAPGFRKVWGNYSLGDYMTIFKATAISLPFGYFVGGPVKVPFMATAGVIGAFGGFLLAYQDSAGRLMGFNENRKEVARAEKLNA